MRTTVEKQFESYETLMSVFGELDSNIDRIKAAFFVEIFASGNSVKIVGQEEDVKKALNALDALETLAKKDVVKPQQLSMVIDCAKSGEKFDVSDLLSTVAVTARGKIIRAKTFGQKSYIDAIKKNSIVFGVGPAGTGKTYLAVALAVSAMKNHEIDRIILTRPAVEAGEKLGFLPGDLAEKVDPYLRPLYDALQEMMGEDNYLRHIESGKIEIAPLAYMRGRTLSNSFIILDEAQNTTKEQMKMFLTRMGENSHIVVTGDVTQIDLPHNVESGMKNALEVLKDVEGIKIVRLTAKDVVRHELVTRIIHAYEKYENKENKEN